MSDVRPPFDHWCPELIQALRQPFPDSAWKEMEIPNRTSGTKTVVPFIPWHRYAERLDELVGPHGWSTGEPRWEVIGSPARLVMAASLTILDVTKWVVVTVELEKLDRKSGEIEQIEGYGGPMERAFASLLKRGCALFGLGREDVYVRKGPAGGARRTGGGGEEPPRRSGRGGRAAGQREAGPTLAQPWQRNKIERLLRRRDVPPNELHAITAQLGPKLTRDRANEIIARLNTMPEKPAEARA